MREAVLADCHLHKMEVLVLRSTPLSLHYIMCVIDMNLTAYKVKDRGGQSTYGNDNVDHTT